MSRERHLGSTGTGLCLACGVAVFLALAWQVPPAQAGARVLETHAGVTQDAGSTGPGLQGENATFRVAQAEAVLERARVAVAVSDATPPGAIAPGPSPDEDPDPGTDLVLPEAEVQVAAAPEGAESAQPPDPGDAGSAATPSAPVPATPVRLEHTVVAGETLWQIAQRYGTSVERLTQANGIEAGSVLIAGRRLVIPSDEASAAPATTNPADASSPASAPKPAPPAVSSPPPWQVPVGSAAEATGPARTPALPQPTPPDPLPWQAPPQPTTWVVGASEVSGAGLGELTLAGLADLALPPTGANPLARLGARTVALAKPQGVDDSFHQIRMEQGKSVFVRTDYPIKRVSVGNPEVLDVVVLSPRELQLIGQSVGGTNVLLWDPSGKPQAAIDVDVGTVHTHLQGMLRKVLPDQDIKVESAGASVALRGTVSSAVAMDQALSIARAFVGEEDEDRVVNLLQLDGNQQVMLKVVVAEMARSHDREMGSNFNTLVESGSRVIALTSFLEGLTTVDEEGRLLLSEMVNLAGSYFNASGTLIQIFLDIVDRKGLGKILAEPTLVARSGETASFLVGGETPIPIAQGGAFGSITIEFKEFGVGVAFTPTVLGSERIHLQVTPEVSEPDFNFGTSVDGTVIPGFVTRRASTSVELSDGQSFVIAGLLSEVVREVAGQYPLLGQIPVLGALFRSSQFQKNETELVIIVTPQLVKPLGPGPHPLPTDHFIEPNAFEFYLLGKLEGRAPSSGQTSTSQTGGLIGDAGHRIPASPEGGLL